MLWKVKSPGGSQCKHATQREQSSKGNDERAECLAEWVACESDKGDSDKHYEDPHKEDDQSAALGIQCVYTMCFWRLS